MCYQGFTLELGFLHAYEGTAGDIILCSSLEYVTRTKLGVVRILSNHILIVISITQSFLFFVFF